MLDQFPAEILAQVLSVLERTDLQAIRLVSRALSNNVTPVLFRTVYASCLTLDRLQNICRHPTLRHAVEELQYQEMNFDLIIDNRRSWDNQDPPFFRHRRTEYLAETIAQSIAGVDPELPIFAERILATGRLGDRAMLDSEQRPSQNEILAMLDAIRDLYAEKASLQNPQRLYEFFREALPPLQNLHRVVCVEAEAGCRALDSPRLESTGALQQLRKIFPMPDYALRLCLQPDTHDWPSHGFMGIWRALSDLDSSSDIRHLEIKRDGNLFLKRGIYIRSLGPQDDDVLVYGFRNLTVLSLCLEVDVGVLSGAIPQATILAGALARASKLRRLEICLTSSGVRIAPPNGSAANYSHFGIPFGDLDIAQENILPFVTFPDLHTVVFEEIDFTIEQICSWVSMQPRLRHLTLRRPYLRGRWQDLVQKWWETPEFRLDSFELNSPWDYDNKDLEENPLQLGTEQQVPSRVPSDAILDFINNGGINPFEARSWRKPWHISEERQNYVEDDSLSNYSDLSEWFPADHPTPVEDLDGPEFDEDYDFDAEEDSDLEMEELGPVEFL
ncbi:uncharacterized protein A1O5_00827 [Cladophialophora psammophila CBS 110553]|uniref:F-box domain-containing protein n=1 Tax=Cladophialophora psammophila CBS 110553 TaxID=1182543 RepID=W9Y1G2_9EURO|nr:uncharacterized protein A1O5_00827 [Cladophialophora psammophila CBS 110553]EXJ76319.1 hypothetical protein A1O5_00827 [Cladophialophora psammophila CBS 110553]